jgi:hypothetical protein
VTGSAVDLVALARALVDIDSTTGREGDVGRWLADYLRRIGLVVTEQPVDAARFNVIARADDPVLVFSTHIDCVPPFFPSRVDGDRLYGRGSCDAKGILAAQVAQGQRGGERIAIPDRRRADRQPARPCDARHPARAAPRGRPRRAFLVPRAGRIGHRQADRRARGAAVDRSAG